MNCEIIAKFFTRAVYLSYICNSFDFVFFTISKRFQNPKFLEVYSISLSLAGRLLRWEIFFQECNSLRWSLVGILVRFKDILWSSEKKTYKFQCRINYEEASFTKDQQTIILMWTGSIRCTVSKNESDSFFKCKSIRLTK